MANKMKSKKKWWNIFDRSKPESEYDGGSNSRRTRGWGAPASGPNTFTLGGLETLRNRSRDLERKVPWVESGIESKTVNTIGTGIVPIPRVQNEELRKQIIELWKDWTEEADAHGIVDFYGMQSLVARTEFLAGECFIRIRKRRASDGLAVPFQLELLEPEFIPLDKNETRPNGVKIRAGIEFDKLGRRIAYHIYKEHPGDTVFSTNHATVRVEASKIIHVFNPKRPGQVRGIPRPASSILRSRDLLEYEDAELVRKKTAAMMMGFITEQMPEDPGIMNEDSDDEEADEGVAIGRLEAGTMQKLLPGEDIKFNTPAESGSSFDPYMKIQLRAVAAGLGITYEQMTGDLTGVNFSSIRAGLNEFQRKTKPIQKRIVHQLCRKVWKIFFEEAVISGALKIPGYSANPRQFNKVDWVTPGWEYVNPQQEVNAKKEAVKAGFTSRSKVVSEKGEDVTTIDEQNAEDKRRSDSLGLNYDVNIKEEEPPPIPES